MGEGLLTPAAGLAVDGVPLDAIAAAVGTPTYVYSAATVRARYGALDAALAGVAHRIHYSLKANADPGVLGVLRALGSGVDVVSGGELFRARRAGFDPTRDIVFGGVGKTEAELREAVAAGVHLVNVESLPELERLAALAAAAGATVAVGLRVNPEVAVANFHAYIATGERGHKFGIPWDDARAVARRALALPAVRLRAIDMHVGSQLRSLDAHARGVERLAALAAAIRADGGADLRYLDVGGGLPVSYRDEPPMDVRAFGAVVTAAARAADLELLVEPGRFVVAEAGTLLCRVLYRKRSGGKEIVITDAGMTELMRPALYGAYHAIEPVHPRPGRIVADVVGPVCETGDFLALDRELADVSPGDLLAVRTAGAYGAVMASNYNARPRAAAVLVDAGRWAVTRDRETYEDLVRADRQTLDWSEP